VRNDFNEHQETTIGAAYLTQSVSLDDAVVRFEIWDTAGQERYRALSQIYTRGAAAALVVFDISSRSSLDDAKTWVAEVRAREPAIVVALVGNKSDLRSGRVVAADEAAEYARTHGLLYVETSAKSGHNVEALFKEVARALPRKLPPKPTGGVSLAGAPAAASGAGAGGTGGGGCC
jgi:Ras-related protein Rab-5C